MLFKKPYLQHALDQIGFIKLTEVQSRVIPLVSKGKDLVVEARTGSGKTHAFLLPIFDSLNAKDKSVQAVICAPTRELARQTYNFARALAAYSPEPLDIRLYVGGNDRTDEVAKLKVTQPQIVIGTPGRLADLIRKENILKAFTAKQFVVDEADMTMDEGFLSDVDSFASVFGTDIQILVFSATIPEKLQPFLKKYLRNPLIIRINPISQHNLQISHYLIKTKEKQKLSRLEQIVGAINPYLALVFCNTKESCLEVYEWFRLRNFNVALLTGDVPYRKRKQLLDRIKRLDYQYVVATDILSRGIDIEGISHIINYELPEDPMFYVHRTGRTGRMDNDGIAISLYEFADYEYVAKLESLGIRCIYKDIREREFVEAREMDARTRRTKPLVTIDRKQMALIKKPRKIKPGYRAKQIKTIRKVQWTHKGEKH